MIINRVNRQIAKRRYYLHKQLDRELFTLDKVTREIQAPGFRHFTDIPVGQRYYIGQLLELGYKIQYEIF